MLLATYAQLTLSIEQKEERRFIQRIRSYLARCAARPQEIDRRFLAAQLEQLALLAESRHRFKLENCLIPALRKATNEAAQLLEIFESLNRSGRALLCAMRASLLRGKANGKQQIAQIFKATEGYCQNLLERLAREEDELLPLAQRVIPSEEWFAIGATFLTQDARRVERKRRQQASSSETKTDAYFVDANAAHIKPN